MFRLVLSRGNIWNKETIAFNQNIIICHSYGIIAISHAGTGLESLPTISYVEKFIFHLSLSVSRKWNRQHDTRLTIKSWHFSSTCKHSVFNKDDNTWVAFNFTLLWTGTSHMQDESVYRKSLHFITPNTVRQVKNSIRHLSIHSSIYIFPLQMSFQRLFASYARMCPEILVSFILWNVSIILANLQNIQFNYNKLWFGLYGHHQKYQISQRKRSCNINS